MKGKFDFSRFKYKIIYLCRKLWGCECSEQLLYLKGRNVNVDILSRRPNWDSSQRDIGIIGVEMEAKFT